MWRNVADMPDVADMASMAFFSLLNAIAQPSTAWRASLAQANSLNGKHGGSM